MSISIGVILGSTRPQRAGENVAKWFMEQTKEFTDVNFKFIDLAEVNLPFLDEPIPPSSGQYQNEHTKQWSKTIAGLDGYIVITPEYNHSFSAVLKNALDFVYQEWARKPMGFVSYGATAGGARAVEQLRLVAVELQMVPMREQIIIPYIWEAFEDGKMKDGYVKGALKKVMDELTWWATTLKPAREKSAAQ